MLSRHTLVPQLSGLASSRQWSGINCHQKHELPRGRVRSICQAQLDDSVAATTSVTDRVSTPGTFGSHALRTEPSFRILELRGDVATLVLGQDTTSAVSISNSRNTSAALAEPKLLHSRALVPLQEFFLPYGFPSSVTPDYLPYQLWTFPTHIAGALSHSLATSALLKAVGVDADPTTATAASAAIKWIAKDGLGAAGRFVVGTGRLGQELDDDPRRMRMVAEALSTVGLALEVATAFKPTYFLLLASLGNFSKAVARGIGKPAFRVIQNHFASVVGNIGGVSAKEEVWEVAAQLVGFAVSVAALQALQEAGPSWQPVLGLWLVTQATHVGLRYRALSVLQFETLNTKRAVMLLRDHVAGRQLQSVPKLNAQEPLLTPSSLFAPGLHLGCTVAEALTDARGSLAPATVVSNSSSEGIGGAGGCLTRHAELFADEQHLLFWHDHTSARKGGAWVVLKEGCNTRGILRAVWQWAWLEQHCSRTGDIASRSSRSSSGTAGAGSNRDSKEGGDSSSGNSTTGPAADVNCRHLDASGASLQPDEEALHVVRQSLAALNERFETFVLEAQALGWDLDTLQVKTGITRIRVSGQLGAVHQHG